MSLREEIELYVMNGKRFNTLAPKFTDDILKLIEKRIDKEINQLEEFKEISSKSKIKEYDIAIKYFKGFKEMLK